MTDRELLQQVLDVLEEIHSGNMTPMAEENWNKAIDAIKARLAQAEKQNPHGWYIDGYGAVIGTVEPKSVRVGEWLPWYIYQPQREWVGITDAEVREQSDLLEGGWISYGGFAQAIEEMLKEKNT